MLCFCLAALSISMRCGFSSRPWRLRKLFKRPASRWRQSAAAPWTITEINAARGRLMTSCSSLKTDLKNALVRTGWIEEVVVDRNLVTGRSPSDIPTFNREMIKGVQRRS